MKQSKFKKILICMVLVGVMAVFASQGVFAAINTEYSQTDPVNTKTLDSSLANSDLFDGIAKLVYAVGNLLEWLLGVIFTLLTGNSDFPWADKIVFNSVPLLDVNFINPDSGSFVGQPAMQGMIKNIYSTILALSVSFFGLAVMITAIKLAISTIASDKAKYKKAITDWLVGFVMVFCIHYLISFGFYLNEELVKVASKIVTSNVALKNSETKVQMSNLSKQFVNKVKNKLGADKAKVLEDNPTIVDTWLSLDSREGDKGLQSVLTGYMLGGVDYSESEEKQYKNVVSIVSWAAENNVSIEKLKTLRKSIKLAVASDTHIGQAFRVEFLNNIFYGSHAHIIDEFGMSGDENECWTPFIDDIETEYKTEELLEELKWTVQTNKYGTWDGVTVISRVKAGSVPFKDKNVSKARYYITNGGKEYARELGIDIGASTDISVAVGYSDKGFYWTEVLDDLIALKSSSTGASSSGTYKRLISDLASYFKIAAFEWDIDGNNKVAMQKTDNVKAENMIMYAVLVGQSLILFISYIKRLFYVVILGLMAPIVVVFDFFQKFGK